MNLIAIAAVAKNRVIGKEGKIPWHIPEDLKRFRAMTMGFPVIMGRGTFESLGKPLDGRTNIVLSKTLSRAGKEIIVARSTNEVAYILRKNEEKTAFVIGGQKTFEEMLHMCGRMWLTEVQEEFEGDTFFPDFDRENWKETFRVPCETHDKLIYHFVEYVGR